MAVKRVLQLLGSHLHEVPNAHDQQFVQLPMASVCQSVSQNGLQQFDINFVDSEVKTNLHINKTGAKTVSVRHE